ncbi:hypothetical protein QQX98_011813 [Neonectria punicea]|uniref:Extracellular mutant protein 11 C-terminal domain-containing protein n=1 Tax=Neonectria punicea TaxID=979145 RepID=A0ABR1GL03_9HYPO
MESPASDSDSVERSSRFDDRPVAFNLTKNEPSPDVDDEEEFFSAAEVTGEGDSLSQGTPEPEETERVIKLEKDFYTDLSPPLSYHGSDSDSNGGSNHASSPPPSYQIPTSSWSGSTHGSTSRPESGFGFDPEDTTGHGTRDSRVRMLLNGSGRAPAGSGERPEEFLASSSPRTCTIVYSQQYLSDIEQGVSAPSQPRHRDSSIGLKSILKTPKMWPVHPRKRDLDFSGSSNQDSSPAKKRKYTHTKERAQATGTSASNNATEGRERPTPSAVRSSMKTNKASSLEISGTANGHHGKTSVHGTPSLLVDGRWIHKSKYKHVGKDSHTDELAESSITPLKLISHDTSSDEAGETDEEMSDTETPSKTGIEREASMPQKHTKSIKNSKIGGRHRGSQQESTAAVKLEFEPELEPTEIRDEDSEHDIKPKTTLAAGEDIVDQDEDALCGRYPWKTDSSPEPVAGAARTGGHQHVRTNRQGGSFWQDLNMKHAKLAKTCPLLFAKKKKLLDEVIEEAMERDEKSRRKLEKKAKKGAMVTTT